MRNILLFRGKGLVTTVVKNKLISNFPGKWVYGGVLDEGKYGVLILDGYDGGITHIPVDPKTVGQYTGLLDKNDTKIFKDDIFLCNFRGKKNKCLVVWEEAGFFVKIITGNYSDGLSPGSWRIWETAYYHRKVIGNIHDNPELLEV